MIQSRVTRLVNQFGDCVVVGVIHNDDVVTPARDSMVGMRNIAAVFRSNFHLGEDLGENAKSIRVRTDEKRT